MRKLSFIGGAILALATATTALAATPVANPSTATAGAHAAVVAHPAHKWTTSFTVGTVTVRGILRASAPYAGGSLTVRVDGVKRDQKVTLVLAEIVGSTSTTLMTRTVTIHATHGHACVTRGLSKMALRALKALPAGATVTLTVTANGSTATGTFASK